VGARLVYELVVLGIKFTLLKAIWGHAKCDKQQGRSHSFVSRCRAKAMQFIAAHAHLMPVPDTVGQIAQDS